MKLTAHEEYGLRCLLQVAGQWPEKSVTIPEVSRREGISVAYAGKLLQILRRAGVTIVANPFDNIVLSGRFEVICAGSAAEAEDAW